MKKFFKLALSLILTSALACCVFGCVPDGDGNGTSNPPETSDTPENSGEGETPENPVEPPEENPDDPEQGQTQPLTYNQKIERYLDGVQATYFTSYVATLAQYDYNAPVASGAVYASPDGNGDGTLANPYSLQDGLDEVKSGGTLYLRGGVYNTSDAEGYFVN
ncbi:MAG: hypothetical protein ACI4MC_04730, partial [Candidatus Coproplasma sp.]